MKSFIKNILSTTIGVIVGSIISLVLFFVVVVGLTRLAQYGAVKPIAKNSILHLRLRGQLVERHRPFDFDFIGRDSLFAEDHTMGLFELNQAIDFARDDQRIAGIYLHIQNFNAGWGSLTSLRRHIADFAKKGKFVYAYADRYDEATYFLATSASRVFLEPSGDVEFNGLAVNEAFLKGLFDKLEVEPKIFRAGKFKAAIEPLILDKMSEENRLQTKTLIDDIWTSAREEYAKFLTTDAQRLDDLADSLKVTSAAQALENGLVHETIFEDEVEARMREFTVGADNELELVTPGRLLHEREKSHRSAKSGKKIAVLFAEGEIVSGRGTIDTIGSYAFRQDIVDAKSDEDVAAIVVRVNSPGGDALASDVIWRELAVTDTEIPVVVSMGDVAASGGYYMSAASRYIFAEPTSITGSIGVFGVLLNTEKFFRNKTGVRFDRVVTHRYADIGDSNRPMEPYEAQVIQRDVDRVYSRFLDVVQEGRGYEKRDQLESIAEGRVWSGLRAKEIGLVDELGGLDEAIAKAAEFAELKETDYDVEVFPKFADPFMDLMNRLSGDAVDGLIGRLGLTRIKEFSESLPLPSLQNGVYTRLPVDLNIK